MRWSAKSRGCTPTALNHISGHKAGVAGIYNRAAYAAEKRHAVEIWATHLATLLAGGKVVKLRRA